MCQHCSLLGNIWGQRVGKGSYIHKRRVATYTNAKPEV